VACHLAITHSRSAPPRRRRRNCRAHRELTSRSVAGSMVGRNPNSSVIRDVA
jgi:hypothetical protein